MLPVHFLSACYALPKPTLDRLISVLPCTDTSRLVSFSHLSCVIAISTVFSPVVQILLGQLLIVGHITTPRALRVKPSHRKGKLGSRVKVIREVIREVAGFAPYEKRIQEILKGGGNNPTKRAVRFARGRVRCCCSVLARDCPSSSVYVLCPAGQPPPCQEEAGNHVRCERGCCQGRPAARCRREGQERGRGRVGQLVDECPLNFPSLVESAGMGGCWAYLVILLAGGFCRKLLSHFKRSFILCIRV